MTRSENIELRIDGSGRLLLVQDQGPVPARAVPCFPWSSATAFVSLRNDQNEEIGFVLDPDRLDEESRCALFIALDQARFVFEIERMLSIEDEYELRTRKVDTRQGPRIFQTKLDDWPRPIPGGGMLIRDLAGDLYIVRDASKLDRPSRVLFQAFSE
jgi:Domain of unknown function (DUF1854)